MTGGASDAHADAEADGTVAFRMPSLGADMEHGRLVEWCVAVGDTVHRGDLIAVIETEKSTIDAEVYVDGVVVEFLVQPGARVPVGTPLATIRTGADAPRATAPTAPAPVAAPARAAAPAPSPGISVRTVAAPPPSPPSPPTGRTARRVSPRARRLAALHGVDASTVPSATTSGAVTGDDVLRAATTTPAPPADMTSTIDVRGAIAKAMTRAKREIPHYYLAHTIDVTDVLAALAAMNDGRPPAARVLPAAVLLHAVALAARDVPEMNGHWIDGGFVPADRVHVGTAIALRSGGLLAPALRDADTLDLDTTMATLRDLVARTRGGKLRSSELADPTITVTNLGDPGVEVVYGVINPPQVAIVGFGRVTEAVLARDGVPVVRSVVQVTLAADHRVSDGVTGSRFLRAVAAHCSATVATTEAANEEKR